MRGIREDRSSYIIQKVCNALDLLEQLKVDAQGELGVSELSRRLDLQKNMVFRLLATLESRNFVEQNRSTGGYRLGLKNLEMSQGISRQLSLKIQARPVLESLTLKVRETSCVTVLKGSCIVCLDAVETPLPVRVVTQLGAWLPIYCTAAGKVHLAAMGEGERLLHLPSELQPYTSRTIVDRQRLADELEQVARQGYALDDEEMELGVRCVSLPVYDAAQRVMGTLSVTGPQVRLSDERLQKEIVPQLRLSCAELSRRLGVTPMLPLDAVGS